MRDEELQSQISLYQELMNDLLEINDSLGLKDASLNEQLDAIRFKNEKLLSLNDELEKTNVELSLLSLIHI